jgi:catechol 2,3-dioxygenase-like lactoylglutathione lyase family enzyme
MKAGGATTETTIPILPCRSMDETLGFYGALGFAVTYRQKRPNTYAVVRRGGIELHFFVLRGLDPASSYGTCYVRAADVDALYDDFRSGLRRSFGRLPLRGVPRIGALKDMSYGVRQFVVVDPGGNHVRIGQPLGSAGGRAHSGPSEASRTRLSKALHAAALLGDSKGDHAAAAEVLDRALARDEPEPGGVRVRALILRADLAVRMGDHRLAGRLLADARKVEIGGDELGALGDDLRRARDLEQVLATSGGSDPAPEPR